jgi:tetratricopeptide (TPR) repeat protein
VRQKSQAMTDQQLSAGSGSVVIQSTGDNVVISVGTVSLTLAQRHRLKATPTSERELLLTELRGTDLVGRDTDLVALRTWLDEPRLLPSVRCLIGRAGAGKTRLAIELCAGAEAAGWTAGFATRAELLRFHDARSLNDWCWGKPTLIVVDYASASAQILRAWLEALARRRPIRGEGPLRLLLLERHADRDLGWWSELIRPGGLSGRGPDELAAPSDPIPLPPLNSAADRRALLTQVIGLAAGFAGKAVPALPRQGENADFDRRLGDTSLETEPLFLVMAGIVGVTTGVPQALALGRTDLAMWIADSEHHRLGRLSAAWGIDTDGETTMLAHLVACITLQGGCDRAATIALIRQEREAMDWQPGKPADWIAAKLAEALHRPEGGVDAIRPDIIGEAFLLRQLATDGRLVSEQATIVTRAWRRDPATVVGSVIRTVQDHAGERPDHPSLEWLDALLTKAGNLGALMQIVDSMPQHTLALRERAGIAQQAVASALNELAGDQPELIAEQARALTNLGIRLSDLGRREDALAVAAEAVSLYRTLAAQRPDAFRPDLAGSLNNLAGRLNALGRWEDALAAAEEAVSLRRTLAAQRPDAFRPDLAMSVNNLAAMLSELGRREDALAAAEEAVSLRRTLAAQRPDAFRPDLAMSVNNLATMLRALGRREDALAAVEEAVSLCRTLAAQRPDVFRPDLAASLDTLANSLSGLGRREDALAAAAEAVSLRRTLAAQRPDVFRPDLAASLGTLANRLSGLGRRDDALAAAEEAVSLRRTLAARRPDAFRPDLAASLDTLANRLSALGRREDALAASEEAVSLYRPLATQRPDTFRPDLAMSVNNLANMLSQIGRREDALTAAEEAVSLYRSLAAQRPDAFRPDLGGSLNNLAARLRPLGRREDALAAAAEAVSLYRSLLAQRPDAFRPDLAASVNNLAAMLSALGRREEALAAAEEAVSLRRTLAAQRPDAFRSDLAMSLMVHAECLDATLRSGEGQRANLEAIETLSDPFISLPPAHAQLMGNMVLDYLKRCERLGLKPDIVLLGPIVASFNQLQTMQGNPP